MKRKIKGGVDVFNLLVFKYNDSVDRKFINLDDIEKIWRKIRSI